MAVYVDDLCHHDKAPIKGAWCHMIADSTEELLAAADAIGHKRTWIQDAGSPREHFDIFGADRRNRAIRNGAVPISFRELAGIIRSKRDRP